MSADYSKWTLGKIKKFIDVLMKVTLCSNVDELKDHIILESVWNEVEKQTNTGIESLKYLWYHCLHLQLFCPEPIYMNDINIKLIECLHTEKVSHFKDIQWNRVATYFDGVPIIFLRKTFYNLIKIVKNTTNIEDMEEMIDYLYNEYIPILRFNDRDKMLPRLTYSKGSISYLDTNIEIEEFTNVSGCDSE